MKKISFNYEGGVISFMLSNPDDVMIDATEMARVISSRLGVCYDRVKPSRWIRSVECQNYVKALINAGQIFATDDVIKTESGGQNAGGHTWLHKRLAIRYAQWLDIMFAIWVDSKIEEIVNNGVAYLNNTINQLQIENMNLKQQLSQLQPQINYYNQVLCNPEALYSTNQIVKQLGLKISNRNLLKMMSDNGMIYKDLGDNQWYVAGTYAKNRYRIATTIRDHTGKIRSVNRWTEAGKYWIWSLALGWKLI